MTNRANKVCYFCGQPATSREHVPPKVFFPDEEDSLTGVSRRENLITVPSCTKHNTDKSQLDEYIYSVIISNINTNPQGLHAGLNKNIRMLSRNKRLLTEVFNSPREVFVKDVNNQSLYSTISTKISFGNLYESVDCIARALYFHHFKKPFIGTTSYLTSFIMYSNDVPLEERQKMSYLNLGADEMFANIEKNGENQDIFYHQFIECSERKKIIFNLCFYENSKIRVTMSLDD